MRGLKSLVLLIVCIALVGCAQTVSKTPAGIELFAVGKDPQELADKAEAHCQQYGLDAQAKNIRLGDGGLERWETFDCVKPGGR